MTQKVVQFLSLLFTALALAPALAHLLELPNKIELPREEYFVVQQIYRGWALLGIVEFGAVASTLALAVVSRHQRWPFRFALASFACIVAVQAIFWTFTFPMNQQTNNWTSLPENWVLLRQQWEYSHAASALFVFCSFVAVVLCVLSTEETTRSN